MMIQSILRPEADVINSDYHLAPDVLFLRVQDGSARLLDLGGNFYSISQTGAQMLYQTLVMGKATAAVSIATEYRVECSHIQNDLHAFLHDLEKKRLIFHTRHPQSAFTNKNILPSLLLIPLLHGISLSPVSQRNKTRLLLTLAHVAIRLFGWPKTVACWQSQFKRVRRVWKTRVHTPASCGTALLEQTVQDIDKVVCSVAAHHLLPVECKERALSCWWLLRSTGLAATLVVGISLFPLECHCWCEVGQWVVSDAQDRCQQFTPILRYG